MWWRVCRRRRSLGVEVGCQDGAAGHRPADAAGAGVAAAARHPGPVAGADQAVAVRGAAVDRETDSPVAAADGRTGPRWSGDARKILKRKGLLLLELCDPTLYPTIGWCRECVSACRLAFAPAGLSLFSRSDPVCLLSCARARSRPLRGAGRASEAPRGPLVGTGVARRRR